jgi:hypothetical protein
MPEGSVGLRNDYAVGGSSEAGEASGGVFTYHSLLFLVAPRSIFNIPYHVSYPHFLIGKEGARAIARPVARSSRGPSRLGRAG